MADRKQKASGYDKYINWKLFILPLGLLILIALVPTPKTMLDVGIEYVLGPQYVKDYFSEKLFNKKSHDISQWQIQMLRMMEASINTSSFSFKSFLKKDHRWCEENNIPSTKKHLEDIKEYMNQINPDDFEKTMKAGYELRIQGLSFEDLKDDEKKKAITAGFQVKMAVGIVLFVVLCFITEAIPLPMVAFCIGIIAIASGIVNRHNIAALYWSDATWFIMGSLMFATAFVKTGVDKRIAMMMFGRLKNPDIKWVTLIIIVIIAPLTMFMSDHALAAMFLPIGILIYTSSLLNTDTEDPELGKMIMITIAMACNLGGSLAPSGAARNIIMMNYAETMFGIQMGFAQWCLYCIPFLLFTIPITWFLINKRFHPATKNLGDALSVVKNEIDRAGDKWTREQKISIIIFIIMLFCWITEKNILLYITGIRFGIGVLAVMGAIAYIFAGIVNWRDYQTKVDWGVVWLYAGAIIFGNVLVQTGGAYWIARTLVSMTSPFGLGEGMALLITGNTITALLTQIMADGPACAAIGPVTLAMAGLVHPESTMIPFMAMGAAISSSFAYCLVIGTPPNAIVYASGYLESKDYLRVGILLWFINLAGLMLMSTIYWRWMGWPGLSSF